MTVIRKITRLARKFNSPIESGLNAVSKLPTVPFIFECSKKKVVERDLNQATTFCP